MKYRYFIIGDDNRVCWRIINNIKVECCGFGLGNRVSGWFESALNVKSCLESKTEITERQSKQMFPLFKINPNVCRKERRESKIEYWA